MNNNNNKYAKQKCTFSGSGSEYFGIWAVNLLLSFLTFGVYSAWAKVRRERYFKQCTRMLGYGFDYHATGLQIFIGRLILLGLLFVLNSANMAIYMYFNTYIASAIAFAFAIGVLPLVVNNALKFSARMTSFRNVRFAWRGSYAQTFLFFVIAPLAMIMSFGLIIPWVSKYYYRYFAMHHSYGTAQFTANPQTYTFITAFIVGMLMPTFMLSILLVILIAMFDTQGAAGAYDFVWVPYAFFVIAFIVSFFTFYFVYSVLCRNLLLKSLMLQGIVSFDSTINPLWFIWIRLTNIILVILSFGLLHPWAKVRLYRYLTESTFVNQHGDIDNFIDKIQQSKSALGEEFADFEGIELGL